MPLTILASTDAVKEILGYNYPQAPDAQGNYPNLGPYIRKASLDVERARLCAAQEGTVLSTDEKQEMCKWLAAWYYTKMDPLYTSRATSKSSGSFAVDQDGYKNAAISADPSGCLATVLSGNFASGFWAGRTPDDQSDYEDRVEGIVR